MTDKVARIQPLLRLTVVLGAIVALGLGGLGLFLLRHTTTTGDPTAIDIGGWTIKSNQAGVIALFLAVVMLVLVVREALRTAREAVRSESRTGSRVADVSVAKGVRVQGGEIGSVSGVVSDDEGAQDIKNVDVLNKGVIEKGKVGDVAGVVLKGKDKKES